MTNIVAALQRSLREYKPDFDNMKTHEMLAFYNRHSDKPVKRFASRSVAITRCSALWKQLESRNPVKVMNQRVTTTVGGERPAMRDSLKLDRRIVMVDTGEVWPNAYRMWCAYPALMSSAQQDRLTKQLYASAKQGVREYVTINSSTYCLFHVNGLPDWSAE
jgi:hypothetical protein